jgi:ion channel-forming bestrophin family protein
MHIGKGYSFKEVAFWTRRDVFVLLIISAIPTTLYQLFHWQWLTLPWLPIALLGTAVAFVVSFKNNASYDRLWEARRIWGAITNASRTWAIMVKDYVGLVSRSQTLEVETLQKEHLIFYKRHFAWLTALRFQLREHRSWEAINLKHNAEFKNKWFRIEEHDYTLADFLKPYLSDSEYERVMSKSNKAAQIIALQSEHLKKMYDQGLINDFHHIELEKILAELYSQQGASERIKNFPYPRQYKSVNQWFIKIFVILIPFGMIPEFAKIGDTYVWMVIPFAALSGWIFTTLERVGEISESPFEGSSNDIPITAISRNIEIDMLEILDIPHDLKPLMPKNNILS